MSYTFEPLHNVTNGSDINYKNMVDAANGQLCTQNKVSFRFIRSAAAAGTIVFQRLIKFKLPFCYEVACRWIGRSDNGAIYVIEQGFQINKTPPNPFGLQSIYVNQSQSIPGSSITISEAIGLNAADISFNNTIVGGTITDIIEIDVYANKLF